MPNYTTVNEYTLTAAESDFTISFDYQKASYVSFKVEDDDLTDVTSTYTGKMIDDTTFQFQDSSGDPQDIPSGYRVTFTRDTDISDDLFTFAAGTVIRPDALGESLKTLRDYTEENVDQLSNTVITAESDAITTATADSQAARDAAQAARDTTLGYRNTAQTHKNDAETAKDAAEAAQTASESARDASQTARDASQTAQTAAETAKAAAESALNQLNNKYHGTHASDSDVQDAIDGDADLTLEAGDIYFNSTSNMLRYYDGNGWYNAAATQVIDTSALGSINDVTFTSLGGDHFIVRSDQNTWVNVGADVVKDKLGLDSADSPTFANLTVGSTNLNTALARLANMEDNATADMTAAEIEAAYEGITGTEKFTTTEQTKLAGIEANADVTDSTNVADAGAVMDTGWSDLAAVKAIDQALDTNADVDFSSVTVEKININGRTISSTDTDGDIEITPNGDGTLKLDGQSWPQAAGSTGQVLTISSGTDLSWSTINAGPTLLRQTKIAGSSWTHNSGGGIRWDHNQGAKPDQLWLEFEVTSAVNNTVVPVGTRIPIYAAGYYTRHLAVWSPNDNSSYASWNDDLAIEYWYYANHTGSNAVYNGASSQISNMHTKVKIGLVGVWY